MKERNTERMKERNKKGRNGKKKSRKENIDGTD
jgi:hypothetical protein